MSEPLYKLAETARVCGWVLLAFCVGATALALAGPPAYRSTQIAILASMWAGHGIPALLYLLLRRPMLAERSAAFMAMTGLTSVCVAKSCVGMLVLMGGPSSVAYALALPCCAPIQSLLLAYVAARCWMAWPEISHLRRVEARARTDARRRAAGRPPQRPAVIPVPPPPHRQG